MRYFMGSSIRWVLIVNINVSCGDGLIILVVSRRGGLITQVVSCRCGLISQVVSCRSYEPRGLS